jgi:S-DNA-T family DNA segregation ATPase FtsK/SpoIIIE
MLPPGLSPRARELLALALCGFSLYAMLCLATFRMADLDGTIPSGGMQNLGGAVGYVLALGFTRSLGLAGWVPFLMLLAYGLLLFTGRSCTRLTIKLLGVVCFSAMLSVLFAGHDGLAGVRASTPCGAGGVFGSVVSPKLFAAFGGTGRLLLLIFGALVSLLIATEWMFSELVMRTYEACAPTVRRWFRRPVAVGVGEVDGLTAPPERPRARRRKAAPRAEAEDHEDDEEVEEEEEFDEEEEELGEEEEEELDEEEEELDEEEEELEADEEVEEEEEQEVEDDEGDASDTQAADAGSAAASSAADSPDETPAETPMVILRPKAKRRRKKVNAQSDLPFQDYPYPPSELFQEPTLSDLSATSEALKLGGEAIVSKLANFNVQATVVSASVGPAVTQYELRLAESIRVNKIRGFEDDLAAVLRAVSVRVVAPIPGKDTVGVEVPNVKREKVFMRDLLDMFGRAEDHAIPLFLGKDVAGNPIVEDLARMPHLLIAGTTGSGKSVCINTILLSILMTRTPQEVKLVLVDPKMVELQAYKKVPHLCCEVVTNSKKAPGVLQWAVDEMDNRYALLSSVNVNHIKSFNRLGETEIAKRLGRDPDPDRVHLSYVVIVIDEFADLMNVASKEVEELIQRLAQKSRAVGMHVIIATQRPSKEVVTGVIKSNLPCQIAFKVNRKIDSRVILDENGADKLLGNGDMLYNPPAGGVLMRAQGTFVTEEEQDAVVRYLEEQGQAPAFNPDLVQRQSSSRPGAADKDDRYYEAVEVIVGQQRGSATLIQRALSVGYTRATRLLELMEDDGIVGPFVGAKSREVLLTLEEWNARREAEEQAADEAAFEYEEEEPDDADDVAESDDAASDEHAEEAPVDAEQA